MRPIDADALKATMIETLEQIKANPKMDCQEMHIIAGIAMLGEMIDDSPTIDAVPVVRGKWKGLGPIPMRMNFKCCSECGELRPIDNFCSNCGADMREDDHD